MEIDDFVNVKINGEILTTNSIKFLSRIIKNDLKIDFKFHNLRHTYRPKGMSEYDKQTMMDLNFVEQNYDRIDVDKFFKTTNGVTEMYYNPDASAGGQIVELTILKDDILEAAKMSKTPDEFFSNLEGLAKGALYDVGTGTFRETAEYLMESKADFEGCTLKTMNALKKYAAPEKIKSEKEPER